MEKKAKNLIVVVVVLAFCAAGASAEIVTIKLEGEITYVDPGNEWLNDNFGIGDVITGSYTYNTNTPDSNPLSTVADYVHSSQPYGISMSVRGFTFQSDPDNPNFLIELLNDHTGMDAYALRSYNNLPILNGVEVDHISWVLVDYSQAALSSTKLSAQPPLLEDWPRDWGSRITFGYKGRWAIDAKVTSIIPEPATVLLLGAGALALFRRTRR